MISRSQARQVADTILEPARRDLESRKERLARFTYRRESPIYPALFAAIAALLAFDYSDNLFTAVGIGTLIGWALGGAMQRPIK